MGHPCRSITRYKVVRFRKTTFAFSTRAATGGYRAIPHTLGVPPYFMNSPHDLTVGVPHLDSILPDGLTFLSAQLRDSMVHVCYGSTSG